MTETNKLEFERGFLRMVIETKRLKIIALTQEQLEMLVDNIPEFEKRLNCSYQGEKIEGIFKNILYVKIELGSRYHLSSSGFSGIQGFIASIATSICFSSGSFVVSLCI